MNITTTQYSIILYIAKCVTGVILLMTVGKIMQVPDVSWAIISMLLVLSPDSKEVVPLTIVRIKANLVASVVSMGFLMISPNVMIAICLAMAITIVICHYLNLMTGSRPALAAIVIILLHTQGQHLWTTPLERVAAVVVGCIIGLVLTYIYHREMPVAMWRKSLKKVNSHE